MSRLKGWQSELESSLTRFTQASQEQLSGMRSGNQQMARQVDQAASSIAKNAQELSGSYAGFVQNVVEGLSRALGMFDENMHNLVETLENQVAKAGGSGTNGETVRQLNQMQQMMAAMTESMQRVAASLEGTAKGA